MIAASSCKLFAWVTVTTSAPARRSGAIFRSSGMESTIGSATLSSADGFVTAILIPRRCEAPCARPENSRPARAITIKICLIICLVICLAMGRLLFYVVVTARSKDIDHVGWLKSRGLMFHIPSNDKTIACPNVEGPPGAGDLEMTGDNISELLMRMAVSEAHPAFFHMVLGQEKLLVVSSHQAA